MISRFFKKKKSKAPEVKKKRAIKPKAEPKPEAFEAKPLPPQRLLTAEGWKRLMMRRANKGK